MKIYFGTELYGRLGQPDGTVVATKFFHISALPLVPLGCYSIHAETPTGFHGSKTRWSLLSLFSAYFKTYGFIAALGLLAWGVYLCDRRSRPWSQFLGVPLAGMALLALVIASWDWFGTRPSPQRRLSKTLTKIAIPCVLALMWFGYWWWDRYEMESAHRAYMHRQALEKTSENVPAPDPAHVAYIVRTDQLNQKLYRISQIVQAKRDWDETRCDDTALRAGIDSERAKHLIATEYSYLVHLPRPGAQRDAARTQWSWTVSPSLVDYPDAFKTGGPAKLDDIDRRPFLGVIVTSEDELPGKRAGRFKLTGWLAIFDMRSEALLCNTRFRVGSTNSVPPEPRVQAAFKKAAQKQLAKISKELRIYEE